MQFNWIEVGTERPVYSVIAKNEKQAIEKLNRYLEMIGKADIKLIKVDVA